MCFSMASCRQGRLSLITASACASSPGSSRHPLSSTYREQLALHHELRVSHGKRRALHRCRLLNLATPCGCTLCVLPLLHCCTFSWWKIGLRPAPAAALLLCSPHLLPQTAQRAAAAAGQAERQVEMRFAAEPVTAGNCTLWSFEVRLSVRRLLCFLCTQ